MFTLKIYFEKNPIEFTDGLHRKIVKRKEKNQIPLNMKSHIEIRMGQEIQIWERVALLKQFKNMKQM